MYGTVLLYVSEASGLSSFNNGKARIVFGYSALKLRNVEKRRITSTYGGSLYKQQSTKPLTAAGVALCLGVRPKLRLQRGCDEQARWKDDP